MSQTEEVTPTYVPHPLAKWYAEKVVRHAGIFVAATLLLVLSLTYIGFFANSLTLDNNSGAFRVRFGEESDAIDSIVRAQQVTVFDPSAQATNMTTQSFTTFIVRLMFENTLEDGSVGVENLLTEEVLTSVRDFENEILAVDDYDKYCLKTPPSTTCDPQFSITNVAFPSIVVGPNGTIVVPDSQGDLVDNFENDFLLPLALNPAYAPYRDAVVHKDFDENNLESSILLSTFAFALPLEGYSSSVDRRDEQIEIVEEWLVESYYELLVERHADESSGVRMLYVGSGITDTDVDNIILGDAAFAGASIIFVFLYVWFHSGSFFITTLGIFHVLMSMPVAYFIFTYIIEIGYFNTLNFLGVFVILGIGADDIFVELDAWKQAAWINNGDVAKPVDRRLAFALERSIKAMTITSTTTAAAFAANLASAIIPIRLFGTFTTLLVITNFWFVCTWFPAVIILHERKNRYGWSSLFWVRRSEAKASLNKASEGNIEGNAGKGDDAKIVDHKPRVLESFYVGPFADFVEKHAKIIIAVGVVCIIVSGWLVTTLEPTTENALLPGYVNVQRYDELFDVVFEVDPSPSKLWVSWGIESIDRDLIDSSDPTSLGEVTFYEDSNSDLWNPDLSPLAQSYFVTACEDFGSQDPLYFVYPDQVYCPVAAMHEFRNASGYDPIIPEASEFQEAMRNWTRSLTGGLPIGGLLGQSSSSWTATAGFDPETEELMFLTMISNSTQFDLRQAQGPEVYVEFQELANEFADDLNEGAPPGLRTAMQASVSWQGRATEVNLQRTGFASIGISLVACFIIVFVTTKSGVIAVLVTLTVTGTVCMAIGSLVVIGYQLGALESIAMTIIVGLAVDYSVHIGHAFASSHASTRGGKARHALRDMGISVTSAAITTVGAATLLLFTTVTLFLKFGVFLFFTVAWSCVYSLVFSLALLFTFGPEGAVDASKRPQEAAYATPATVAHGQKAVDASGTDVPF